MNISAMFRSAVEEFDARVRLISDHQWQAATPDEDWRVRDLVNHVVAEDLWAPPLLAGSTIDEVGDRFEGDVVAADPTAAWAAASAGAVQAVGEDGAMDRIVHLSFGDFPGREYALQLFADHLIHAWDLARAIGADERLDAMLVASCATWFDAVEDAYRSA
ncbi:MAG TPA: TIGR03086 family metal-binding protein, partial [Streptosporangiaceae bacterium]|nr:TIGR03086 family metal-binding protein [Streptosporangiaceae bacterium]